MYFLYILETKNPCFVTKNCWKSSYICVFILSKKRRSWFHKNLHNSGMFGRRELPDPSLNHILNALSIGLQYTLSFELTNFGLKCLLRDRREFIPGQISPRGKIMHAKYPTYRLIYFNYTSLTSSHCKHLVSHLFLFIYCFHYLYANYRHILLS